MTAKSPTIKAWPADSVERRSVDSLIPYARNSRTHSDEQVAQIAGERVDSRVHPAQQSGSISIGGMDSDAA